MGGRQDPRAEAARGVTFHNGEAFDADDVVFTYNTMSAKDSGARYRALVDWIHHVEKIDAATVRIPTKTPFPQALEFLAGPLPIYPNEYYQKVRSNGMALATPVCHPVSKRVDALFDIEREINGLLADERLQRRRRDSQPLLFATSKT